MYGLPYYERGNWAMHSEVAPYNRITTINAVAFRYMRDLRQISLMHNILAKIPLLVFPKPSQFTNMQFTLDLSSNAIVTIEPGTLKKSNPLKDLFINKDKITVIKNYFSKTLDRCFCLMLDDNAINIVEPLAFQGLKCLQVLKLARNKIKIIYQNMFVHLSHYTVIYFYSNQIKIIELKAFKGANNLNHSFLRYNKIKTTTEQKLTNYQITFPTPFMGLKYLMEIMLNFNLRQKLPN